MEITTRENEDWSEIISADHRLFNFKLEELWRYRDLLLLLVKRDFVATYKQTILGPIWFFLQPLLVTLTFVVVFGNIANISTDGIPQILFYLSGITLWNYFSECFTRISSVFKDNAGIFGKVYFPRLIMPLSIVVSSMIKLGIQFLLFLIFWIYFLLAKPGLVEPNIYMLLTPLLIIIMGILGLGFGMIISALTTKYRDLIFLLTFAIQLLMYATPVIYPLSSIPEKYRLFILANPMSSIIETFKFAFLGKGTFEWTYLLYSTAVALFVLFFGILIFNKVEKTFMDTV